MPFVKGNTRPVLQGASPEPEADEPAGFFGEVLPAALRTENLIGSFLARDDRTFGVVGRPRDDFDPFIDIDGYEEHAVSFALANNEEDIDGIKANIDREREDRKGIAEAGAGGFVAAMAAGIIDPTVFIPVGGQLKKGESVLRVSRRTLAAGGAAVTAQEVGLQSTQELRTPEESALNVAAGALLSGVLGGSFAALSSSARANITTRIKREMTHPGDGIDPLDPMQTFPFGAQSVGAARLAPDATATETLADNAIAFVEKAAKKASIVDPTLRLMTSQSNGARKLGQSLAEIPSLLEKNRAKVVEVELPDGTKETRLQYGRPTQQSVEGQVARLQERLLGQAQEGLDDIYVKYLRGRERQLGDRFIAGAQAATNTLPHGKLSPRDFDNQVFKALSRNDESEIPEVAQAAAHLRKTVFDPVVDEAVDLGFFGYRSVPSDVPGEPDVVTPIRPDLAGTAQSYRPRLYNFRRIAERRPEFVDRVENFFKKELKLASKSRGENQIHAV